MIRHALCTIHKTLSTTHNLTNYINNSGCRFESRSAARGIFLNSPPPHPPPTHPHTHTRTPTHSPQSSELSCLFLSDKMKGEVGSVCMLTSGLSISFFGLVEVPKTSIPRAAQYLTFETRRSTENHGPCAGSVCTLKRGLSF